MPRILSIGQCGIDGPRIEELLREKLEADVEAADDASEAAQQLDAGRFDLVLVNRELAMTGDSGLDVIRTLAGRPNHPPIMLVSDRADAQQEAQSLGAIPGFGKAKLDDASTLELLRKSAGASH